MNYTDLINGLFECVGAAAIIVNIVRLLQHKELKGVHWLSTVYFTLWGVWNLYFYPMNGLWLSFAGGVAIMLSNTVWLGLVFYYKVMRNGTTNSLTPK